MKRHANNTFLFCCTRHDSLLVKADLEECRHCGGHCEWDAESEWQEKWNDWESKLAYYDRTYGPLLDEWYVVWMGACCCLF